MLKKNLSLNFKEKKNDSIRTVVLNQLFNLITQIHLTHIKFLSFLFRLLLPVCRLC
jgi:hypothetical protein